MNFNSRHGLLLQFYLTRALFSLAYLYISSLYQLYSSLAYSLVLLLAYSIGFFGFVVGLFVNGCFFVAILCCNFT